MSEHMEFNDNYWIMWTRGHEDVNYVLKLVTIIHWSEVQIILFDYFTICLYVWTLTPSKLLERSSWNFQVSIRLVHILSSFVQIKWV